MSRRLESEGRVSRARCREPMIFGPAPEFIHFCSCLWSHVDTVRVLGQHIIHHATTVCRILWCARARRAGPPRAGDVPWFVTPACRCTSCLEVARSHLREYTQPHVAYNYWGFFTCRLQERHRQCMELIEFTPLPSEGRKVALDFICHPSQPRSLTHVRTFHPWHHRDFCRLHLPILRQDLPSGVLRTAPTASKRGHPHQVHVCTCRDRL